jgi:hypothetical protein
VGLKPLDYKVKEIYDYSRRHIPACWWRYYYGNEPYCRYAKDKQARYATIFIAPSNGLRQLS